MPPEITRREKTKEFELVHVAHDADVQLAVIEPLTYFKYTNDQWMFSTEDACGDGNYFDINTNHQFEKDYLAASRCVVCLQLTKG